MEIFTAILLASACFSFPYSRESYYYETRESAAEALANESVLLEVIMDITQYEEMLKDRNCMHPHIDMKESDYHLAEWENDHSYTVCEDCGVDMAKDEADNDYYRHLVSEGLHEDCGGEWDTDTHSLGSLVRTGDSEFTKLYRSEDPGFYG